MFANRIVCKHEMINYQFFCSSVGAFIGRPL